ncbi:SUMF1/EgtB/PvdO family nonheme iron enzyme [Segatella hominis]|uniref:SUMF1/EgtB/PvdO family nonheme iron enzyme n=1 Tax=Segatella hominis TaxID=2518605 RepID=UPI002113EB4D|nr:SUMF1/EgtB/PvdO family nonheme iron enzyme [Segatella hominis]WOZ80515.1 SUMF1/EgtB/PvdO family nonheme iron enzyme [Segatella hominis]
MKRVLGFIFCLLISLGTFAQKLSVESFSLAATDISAQTQQRKDLNDEPCALVKVQFVGDILDVEGNVIKPLVKNGNETWAYMTHGSQQMKVLTKDYLPIMVDFSNYGISQVEKNKTYVLVLTKPANGSESVIQQKQSLIIRYTPSTATVLVDNKMVRGSNGVAKTTLPVGQHSYIVACDGYESEEGTVKLKASAPSNLQITLTRESVGAGIVNQQQSENQQLSNTYVASSSNNSSGSPSVASGSNAISIPVKDGISIEMVKVEAGTFMMGATSEMKDPYDDEKPVHQVTLTNDYYMGKYEVPQALWEAVMGSNPSEYKGDNLPVEMVSWNDCQEFISKLNSLTGRKFRLPTEAEWEYAARGGKKSRGYQYSGNSNISDVAWYDGNSGSKPHPVGTKQANELGIYDMSGNVYEWCSDWYGSYSSSSQTNPTGADSGSSRVYRGGSWRNGAWLCRLSCRYFNTQFYRGNALGLRLALSE